MMLWKEDYLKTLRQGTEMSEGEETEWPEDFLGDHYTVPKDNEKGYDRRK